MKTSTVYYKGTRAEITPFLPKQYSKVLEIGCGKGGFRDNLDSNCEYWGVEPVESIAKISMEKLDKVLIGTFEDVKDQLPENYFDLIICNDVIEHMVDHDLFYKTIKEKMISEAYMIGAIPNVRYLPNLYELIRKKDWEYKQAGVLDRTHLRFFTEKSIKRDFINHNFEIEKLEGINGRVYTWSNKSDVFMNIMKMILGKDTQYLQFGFRIRIV